MHIKDYKLDNMCATLEISKRTYYKYRNAEDKDYYDYLLIKEIFDESKKTYGYRRICDGLLIKYGVIFNHKKVQRIMAKYALKPEYAKRIRTKPKYRQIVENVIGLIEEENGWKINTPTYLKYNDRRDEYEDLLEKNK